MYPSTEMSAKNIVVTLPSKIVQEAETIFPRLDVGALALTLLEKYLLYQKRKLLAQQYRQYYQNMGTDDLIEEKQMFADFAILENEVNTFIQAAEANGGS